MLSNEAAQTLGAVASMLIYVLMAAVLFFRPEGYSRRGRADEMLSKSQIAAVVLLAIALVLAPPITTAIDEPFYTSLVARIMVFAIAVVSWISFLDMAVW